jgi:hypothetical protein
MQKRIKKFSDFAEVFRGRLDELGGSLQGLDHTIGLATGYSSKILRARPAKGLGPATFDALTEILGIEFIVVTDDTLAAKYRHRLSRKRSGEGS